MLKYILFLAQRVALITKNSSEPLPPPRTIPHLVWWIRFLWFLNEVIALILFWWQTFFCMARWFNRWHHRCIPISVVGGTSSLKMTKGPNPYQVDICTVLCILTLYDNHTPPTSASTSPEVRKLENVIKIVEILSRSGMSSKTMNIARDHVTFGSVCLWFIVLNNEKLFRCVSWSQYYKWLFFF